MGIGTYAGQGCLYKDLYIEQIDDDGNVIGEEPDVGVEEAEIPDVPPEEKPDV